MFEDLVSEVKGEWLPKYGQNELSLKWTVNGHPCGSWVSRDLIGALSVWLKRQPPTPNDLAETIVDKWRRDNEVEMNSVGWVVRFEARRDLIARIAVALRAERERESRNV